MEADFFKTLSGLRAKLGEAGESAVREELQNLFDGLLRQDCTEPAAHERLLAAQGVLREFYDLRYGGGAAPRDGVFDLAALCRAAAFCADALCCESRKRVFFFGGGGPVLVSDGEKQTAWTLLRLIGDALLSGEGKYVGLELRRGEGEAWVSVCSARRSFRPERSGSAPGRGNGRLCALLRGRNGRVLVREVLRFSPASGAPGAEKAFCDYVGEWLGDRLSFPYTALCEMA